MFTEWRQRHCASYEQIGRERLRTTLQEDECYIGTPSQLALKQRRSRLVLDCTATQGDIHTCVPALELSSSARSSAAQFGYLPIRFIPDEKLTAADKLLLAFDAFALTLTFGKTPYKGKIIHGSQYSNSAVPLPKLLDAVRSLVDRIAKQQAEATPPPLVLNKHCPECEFQPRCRKLALEKDELTLLANLTAKDRKQQHEKGIFTVTQLSYTFRPRKRAGSLQLKRQHALRALAIRKNQIHVLGTPTIAAPGTPVYFDVEGVPDRDFYYLVGLRCESGRWVLCATFVLGKRTLRGAGHVG